MVFQKNLHVCTSMEEQKSMKTYLNILQQLVDLSAQRDPDSNRTDIAAYRLFAQRMQFDLSSGFPLVTTKAVHFKAVVHELLWFLSGKSCIDYLHQHNVKIWDEWADCNNDLGPVYGVQWRNWKTTAGNTIDQIDTLIKTIKTDPTSRRLIISAWNVGDLAQMKLQPCHILCQFFIAMSPDGGKPTLHSQLTQRSADMFLGVPFNIASYALLTHMIAHVCNLNVGTFTHTLGDTHLYENHVDKAQLQLSRTPRSLPTISLNPGITNIDDFCFADIFIHGYSPHPRIPAAVAV